MSEGTEKVRSAEITDFLHQNPALDYFEAFVTDINGIARGKRLPAAALDRVCGAGLNLPASTLVLDVWGNEVEATGLIFDTGDADHPCRPVPGSLRPLPWTDGRGGQLLLSMQSPTGERFHGDPRNVLAGVVERFAARGLTPVIATELEFRLFEADPGADGIPRPPAALTGYGGSQLFGLDELDAMGLFAEIDAACRAQGLRSDTVIAEQSDGQYEVNLRHVDDPLLAADHAILLKRTVKAVARRHGLVASFMAKPFGDQAGNGLHVHVSLCDADGRNVLASTDGSVNDTLRHAIGGVLDTLVDAAALFAPHANSWRRFQPGCHVPMGPTWGTDNRTTAVRVPLSDFAATRIEHRVAGADANPYLAVAAVLAGIDHGLTQLVEPPPETHGSAFSQHASTLPESWEQALTVFEGSDFIGEYFGAEYRRLFAACKRQEQARFRRDVPRIEYETYLGTI